MKIKIAALVALVMAGFVFLFFFRSKKISNQFRLDGSWKIMSLDTPANVVVGGEDSFLNSAVGTVVNFERKLTIGEKTFCEEKFSFKEVEASDQYFVVLQGDKQFPGLDIALGDTLKTCQTKSGSFLKPSDAPHLREINIDKCEPSNNVTFLVWRFFIIDESTMLGEYEGNYLCLKRL